MHLFGLRASIFIIYCVDSCAFSSNYWLVQILDVNFTQGCGTWLGYVLISFFDICTNKFYFLIAQTDFRFHRGNILSKFMYPLQNSKPRNQENQFVIFQVILKRACSLMRWIKRELAWGIFLNIRFYDRRLQQLQTGVG